ncbi:immunoglobulin-like domain-containing protein [uncultured Draconibacterium sp.]|uniref:immunoglobulin-like domain-containing protein n=1 Tax=uncultured Draconibacterium sp. TaxID=1573823 RepID=UPI0029C8793F|nr:immunoglobulin-like domain-containing protein [uncultured Draconibacterium sp.]
MKILKFKLLVIVSLILFSACEKEYDSFITKITYFPSITFQGPASSISPAGDQFLTILKGETFVDPGVIVAIGDEIVEDYDITGDVDVNTVGVYTITYSKKNEDGYAASARRYVGVIDPNVVGNDFSGQYQRTNYGGNTTPSGISEWTKLAEGLYAQDNTGGVPDNAGYVYNVYVFNLEGNKIFVPEQTNAIGGDIYCTSGSGGNSPDLIDFFPGEVGEIAYIWGVKGTGYGTNTRTFTRVE